MNKEAVSRDVTFDLMKGIGILLVLMGHVWGVPTVNHFIRSFHMPLFFIVAGYFSKSYSSQNNPFPTVFHYIKRLVPPFVFATLITVIWFCFMGFVKDEWNPAICNAISLFWADACILPTSFGGVSIGVVWFLLALCWAKILLLFISHWEKWVLPVSFSLSIAALCLHEIFPYSIWCFSLGLVCMPFVAIGWWCKKHVLPLWLKIIAIIAWIVAIVFSNLDLYSYTWKCYPLDVLGACGGTYFIYLICQVLARSSLTLMNYIKLGLGYLGRISLSIMCVHCFEMASHLGSHLWALIGQGYVLPIWGMYVWRYVLTILLAIAVVNTTNKIKKIFM
jgi:Fucose 4-O-acetylase and related acetyltransferases